MLGKGKIGQQKAARTEKIVGVEFRAGGLEKPACSAGDMEK